MKRLGMIVGIVGCVALAFSGAQAAQDAVYSQNVVGYYNITVNSGLNLVAFPFQKIPAARGVVTANTGTQITDAQADWADGFGYDEPGESTFYVEITGGAFEGRHFYVAENSGDTLTILGGLGDVGAGELVGAGYKIVAANRVRDLFGEPGAALLAGGTGPASADNILRWTGTGWSAPVYYNTSAFGAVPDNWYQGGQIVNDLAIDRDEAVFVRRRGATDTVLTVVGEVSQNSQQVILDKGLNLVGGLSVVDEVIGASLLDAAYTGGSGPAVADNVLAWTGTGWSAPIYYNTSAFGATPDKWYQSGAIVHDTFAFSPVRGYFMRLRGDPKDAWVRPSPLAAQ